MGIFQRKNKEGVQGKSWYVDYYDPNGKRIIKKIGQTRRMPKHI
jgi:hypothetical protein